MCSLFVISMCIITLRCYPINKIVLPDNRNRGLKIRGYQGITVLINSKLAVSSKDNIPKIKS